MVRPITVDRHDWHAAEQSRLARAQGDPVPLQWTGLLDRLSPGGTRPATPRSLLSPAVLIAWNLMPSTFAAAALRRPLIYLCWGIGHFRGVRGVLARWVLRRARIVLVNDPRSETEVATMAGVTARRVPYLVDTDFFAFVPPARREDFLFCPSSNDRDGEVLLALAEAGHRIVWMNNDLNHHARFGGRHPGLSLVSRPSFAELRGFYARAAAVVLPLVRDVHAAGQTTALEAIASGAPVVISAGRTAELLAPRGLVHVVATSDAAAWASAIRQTIAGVDGAMLRARSQDVAAVNGVEPVTAVMRAILHEVAR